MRCLQGRLPGRAAKVPQLPPPTVRALPAPRACGCAHLSLLLGARLHLLPLRRLAPLLGHVFFPVAFVLGKQQQGAHLGGAKGRPGRACACFEGGGLEVRECGWGEVRARLCEAAGLGCIARAAVRAARLTVNTNVSLTILDASSTLFSSVMDPMKARPSLPSARRVTPTSKLCADCDGRGWRGWQGAGRGGLVWVWEDGPLCTAGRRASGLGAPCSPLLQPCTHLCQPQDRPAVLRVRHDPGLEAVRERLGQRLQCQRACTAGVAGTRAGAGEGQGRGGSGRAGEREGGGASGPGRRVLAPCAAWAARLLVPPRRCPRTDLEHERSHGCEGSCAARRSSARRAACPGSRPAAARCAGDNGVQRGKSSCLSS